MIELRTVDEVVVALGGTKAVAGLAGRTDPAISNWRKAGQFPANTYLLLKGELEKIGKAAPDSLWAKMHPERVSP
jgi:hypothetical protein